MAIQDFDYQGFAQNLTQQAVELVPADFADNEKQYVVNTLLNFSTLAGEALYNDTESNFNADQAMMITQIIAEWSFHKSVDLIRSGIPQEFWDSIMQKIAFTIFEIAKQTFKQGLPQDQILQLIEHHVKKTYIAALEELKEKGMISAELQEVASQQSNIDTMMEQMNEDAQSQQEAPAPQDISSVSTQPQPAQRVSSQELPPNPKILKLATVALLFKKMKQDKVQTILNKFNPDDAQTVIKYMGIPDLESKVSVSNAIRCLNEIKTNLPTNTGLTTGKIVTRLQKVTEGMDRQQIETILRLERQKVKRLVFNALEGEYYEMPPMVANIIATHIQDSV